MSFAARARSARTADDTTRVQINKIPEKSHFIIILINIQGQITPKKPTNIVNNTSTVLRIRVESFILC